MNFCRKFSEKDYEDAALFKDFISMVRVPVHKTGEVEERLSRLKCNDSVKSNDNPKGDIYNGNTLGQIQQSTFQASDSPKDYNSSTGFSVNLVTGTGCNNIQKTGIPPSTVPGQTPQSKEEIPVGIGEQVGSGNTWKSNSRPDSPSCDIIANQGRTSPSSKFNDLTIIKNGKFGTVVFDSKFAENKSNEVVEERNKGSGNVTEGLQNEYSRNTRKYGNESDEETGKLMDIGPMTRHIEEIDEGYCHENENSERYNNYGYSSRYSQSYPHGKMFTECAYDTPRKREVDDEFYVPKRPLESIYKRSASTGCVLGDIPMRRPPYDSSWASSGFYSFDDAKFSMDSGPRRFKSFDESIDQLKSINRNAYETTEDGEGFVCAYCEARYIYKRCLVNHLLKSHRKIMKLL